MGVTDIEERVKALQRRLGVKPDGVVGPITLTRLESLADVALGPAAETAAVEFNLLVSESGLHQIVAFEISSEANYVRRLQNPIWPGGQSGVTIGVGYDLGFNTENQIAKDWGGRVGEADLKKLASAAKVTGEDARRLLSKLRQIVIPLEAAKDVFFTTTLPRFAHTTRRVYPGVDKLPADAQAMLLSLIYNRGPRLSGPTRAEMKAIRDLVPLADLEGIAAQIRAMKRLWDPAKLPGLHIRRDKEAELVAGADRDYEEGELVRL